MAMMRFKDFSGILILSVLFFSLQGCGSRSLYEQNKKAEQKIAQITKLEEMSARNGMEMLGATAPAVPVKRPEIGPPYLDKLPAGARPISPPAISAPGRAPDNI